MFQQKSMTGETTLRMCRNTTLFWVLSMLKEGPSLFEQKKKMKNLNFVVRNVKC